MDKPQPYPAMVTLQFQHSQVMLVQIVKVGLFR